MSHLLSFLAGTLFGGAWVLAFAVFWLYNLGLLGGSHLEALERRNKELP